MRITNRKKNEFITCESRMSGIQCRMMPLQFFGYLVFFRSIHQQYISEYDEDDTDDIFMFVTVKSV